MIPCSLQFICPFLHNQMQFLHESGQIFQQQIKMIIYYILSQYNSITVFCGNIFVGTQKKRCSAPLSCFPVYLCFLLQIPYHDLLLIIDMFLHNLLCCLYVALQNRLCNLIMLPDQILMIRKIFYIFKPVSVHLLAQIHRDRNQLLVLRCPVNRVVETLIAFYDCLHIL